MSKITTLRGLIQELRYAIPDSGLKDNLAFQYIVEQYRKYNTTDQQLCKARKLFVGGLSWETTQDNLQRTIDPKPCNPRTLQKPKKGGGYPKVFLGGLPSNVTETDLRSFFTRFGKVMEVVIMYDQEKKKSRGFGFLSFEDDEAVDRCVSEHFVNLNGKQVEIKKAEPRDGSGGNKMGGSDGSSAWGPPQAPLGMMQGPNGQMGGPPMNMGAPMGPNMNQGYLGWGTSPQQQYNAGYGTPSGPGSYQGWGAPPAPQGPPPQWGNSYGGPPTQQGYGSYGYMATGDVYSRGGQSAAANPSGPPGTAPSAGTASKPGSDYGPASYGSAYGSYSDYSARSTAPYGTADSTGGYSSQPPQAAGGKHFTDFKEWPAS
ncbi:hypothetical protein HUJ05_011531 [Dendroctonus ponderosae]|nr:hypothetical protein HUJ05_011531 [Dendroctonus ponderosae]